MLRFYLIVAIAVGALGLGCDSSRRRGVAPGLVDTPSASGSAAATNVYRFVGTRQSLGDARLAFQDQRWSEAIAASQELLKQEPGHLEAQKILEQSTRELGNAAIFEKLEKVLAAKDVGASATQFAKIAVDSVYYARARVDYEKVRDPYVAARETEARALVARGRCRDAHRVARSAGDVVPEMRARLDQGVDGCRTDTEIEPPPAHAPVAVVAPAHAPMVVVETAARAPTTASTAARAPVAVVETAAPVRAAATATQAQAQAATQQAPTPAQQAPTPTPMQTPAAASAPPPAPAVARPKMISAAELEKLRIAGEQRPSLPGNAKVRAHRDGIAQIVALVGLCVGADGVPQRVDLEKKSDYSEINEKVVSDVRSWRFRPYTVGDAPAPVCTKFMLMWRIE